MMTERRAEMERLTYERLNGIRDGYWSPNKKQELVDRLAAYENTDLDPEQVEHVKETAKKYLLEKAQGKAGGWIPAKKALPPEPPEYVDDEDDLEEYIVMIDGAERPTTLRYAGGGTWWEDGTYYPVIAWRPLPEPYRTERSESKAMREIGKVIISGIEAGIHQGVRENEQG